MATTEQNLTSHISVDSPTFREEIEDYASLIYERLSRLVVELDPDPLSHGPNRLNLKTADARNGLSSVTQMNIEVLNSLRGAKRILMYEEGILELKIKDMVVNDPKVKGFSTAKEREYFCQLQYKTDFEKISRLKEYVQNLEFLLEAIKLKISDMRDLQVRIQNQVRLCESEISIGNKWGTKQDSLEILKNKMKNGSSSKEEPDPDKPSAYQNFKREIEERKKMSRMSSESEDQDSDCQVPEVLLTRKPVDTKASDRLSDEVENFLNS
jgi:hypothetical protein